MCDILNHRKQRFVVFTQGFRSLVLSHILLQINNRNLAQLESPLVAGIRDFDYHGDVLFSLHSIASSYNCDFVAFLVFLKLLMDLENFFI
ncbi:hypothetical protein DICVIV_11497 [Dictyocaulus viviparus]|uniref:Uncharacterized protein n=1 Tax=Dictyocaulus viviparus TaxID=29172 RepID=A0A0D8XD06_DICVI|nr:hypothetical protein DICVIV_11497 [Dictyocaulus viviparus]